MTRGRPKWRRGALLAFLLCVAALATAAAPIAHPDPATFDAHIRETLAAALADYEQAGGDRADGEAHGALAMVYHAHELLEPARQAYLRAAERAPTDVRWPYYLGLIAADSGRLEEASVLFNDSLAKNPGYGPAKLRLGRALIALNRLQDAAEVLARALAEHPEQAAIHAESGRLNQQLGRPREAVEQLQRALELQPGANALYLPLAMAYRDLGEAQRAREFLARGGQRDVIVDDALNRRLRSLSRSYSYYLKLGMQAAAAGDMAAAERHLQAALRISPDNIYVLSGYALVLEADGRLQAALDYNGRALALDGNYAVGLEQRGMLLEMSGDEAGAVDAYQAALAADAHLADARRLLGNALMRAEKYSEAAGHYRIAGDQKPAENDLRLHLAVAEYEAGDCPQAADILASAVQKTQAPGTLLAYARVVATCPDVSADHRAQALAAMRQLYGAIPSLHAATTLAMIEAAAGDYAAAADYQAQAMFLAARESRQDLHASLKHDLEGYQHQRLPQRPWQTHHPLARPPRITPENRRKNSPDR